jgi:hypothetical protein
LGLVVPPEAVEPGLLVAVAAVAVLEVVEELAEGHQLEGRQEQVA